MLNYMFLFISFQNGANFFASRKKALKQFLGTSCKCAFVLEVFRAHSPGIILLATAVNTAISGFVTQTRLMAHFPLY